MARPPQRGRGLMSETGTRLDSCIRRDNPMKYYNVLQIIGSGSYGQVYTGRRKQQDGANSEEVEVALKRMLVKDVNELIHLQTEITLLYKLDHCNIVRYYDSFYHNKCLWLVMELCQDDSLQDIYNNKKNAFNEDQIAFVMREMFGAVSYIHSKHVMHRDIKGANILLTQKGDVKLADFGVSVQTNSTMDRTKTLIGTPYWMAPEMASADNRNYTYSNKCDIWALGIVAIELAHGQPPNYNYEPKHYLTVLKGRKFKSPKLSNERFWSGDFYHFVSWTLSQNALKRPTADDVLRESDFVRKPDLGPHLMRVFLKKQKRSMDDFEGGDFGVENEHPDAAHGAPSDIVVSQKRAEVNDQQRAIHAPPVNLSSHQWHNSSSESITDLTEQSKYENNGRAVPLAVSETSIPDVSQTDTKLFPTADGQSSNQVSLYENSSSVPTIVGSKPQSAENDALVCDNLSTVKQQPAGEEVHILQYDRTLRPGGHTEDENSKRNNNAEISSVNYGNIQKTQSPSHQLASAKQPPHHYQHPQHEGLPPNYNSERVASHDSHQNHYQGQQHAPVAGAAYQKYFPQANQSPEYPRAVYSNVPVEAADAHNKTASSIELQIKTPEPMKSDVAPHARKASSPSGPQNQLHSAVGGSQSNSSFSSPLPAAAATAITAQSKPQAQSHQSGKPDVPEVLMGAMFSKVFDSVPFSSHCAVTWVNPETNTEYILFASDNGVYSLDVEQVYISDPQLTQIYSSRTTWMQIHENQLLSISGNRKTYVCQHDLAGLYTTNSQTLRKSGFSKYISSRIGLAKTQKIQATRGCLKCCLTKTFNDTHFMCTQQVDRFILFQWYENKFKELHSIRLEDAFERPLSVMTLLITDKTDYPYLCYDVEENPSSPNHYDVKVLNLDNITQTLGSTYKLEINTKRAPDKSVVKVCQLEKDTLLICFPSYIRITNLEGKLKSTRKRAVKLNFDGFRIRDIVVLDSSVLAFHDHGMIGKSFETTQVTQNICDHSQTYRLLDSSGLIVVESVSGSRVPPGASSTPAIVDHENCKRHIHVVAGHKTTHANHHD